MFKIHRIMKNNATNILTMIYYIYKCIYNLCVFLTNIDFKKINKLYNIKNKLSKIDEYVKANLSSIDIQLDKISDITNKSGIVSSFSLIGPQRVIDNFDTIVISSTNISKNEITIDENSFLKNGIYTKEIKNLIEDKDYFIEIKPYVGNVDTVCDGSGNIKNHKHLVGLIKSENGKNVEASAAVDCQRDYVPSNDYLKNKDYTLRDIVVSPYVQRKQTTGIDVYIDNILVAKIIGGEYCEVSSIVPTYFNSSNGSNGELRARLSFDSYSTFIGASYGGKGYNEYPIGVIFRNSNKKSVELKFVIYDLCYDNSGQNTPYGLNTTSLDNSGYSCLSNIHVTVETYYQDRPINQTPQDLSNINNPELDYGDGGERYYEPWKFWFEGDLGSDENGGASWYKKWKSWLKKKVKNHNDRLDGKGTEDIDAWMEDNKHKGDHL